MPGCHFFFGPVAFFGQFNKIYVFNFSRPFQTRGEIFSGSRGSKKVSRFRGKNISSKPPPVRYLWPKQKKKFDYMKKK